MTRGQAMVLILEQGLLLVTLLWFVVRFGKWTETRHKAHQSAEALVHELQMHRIASGLDAANHVASFTYEDREEAS